MSRGINSVRSILKFTMPLILSELSVNLMFLISRMVLGKYSIDAMSAVTISGNFVMTATFAIVSTVQIANVFVGQYNGRNDLNNVASPSWQMIYFSLASFIIFIPLSIFTEYVCLAPECYKADAITYQRIMVMFAGLPAIICALSSFFIGTKRTKIVVIVIAVGNLIALLLNVMLIFGVGSIIPSIGVSGAAISSVVSWVIQIVILLAIFLNKNNRKKYHSHDYTFKMNLFIECIKTGIPLTMVT